MALRLLCRFSCVLPALVLVGCLHVAGTGRGGRGTADLAARAFADGFGRRAGPGMLALFADSAQFELQGMGVLLQSRNDIRELLEYGVVVQSRLKMREVEVMGDTASCRLEERNEWFKLLGVEPVYYRCRVAVNRGRISLIRIKLEPGSQDALSGRLAEFMLWLMARDPQAAAGLLPGGRFAYTPGTARALVAQLRLWRSG